MTNYSIQSIVNSLFTNTQNVVIYRKEDSEFSEEREPLPVVNRLCLFCSQTD